ncbi:MAG: hypothetical protein RLZZ165_2200 [Bacteroidota bacterium]|jgi:sugar O-acyltransferase (sialic acid O-acetyltransferase NeuD family)
MKKLVIVGGGGFAREVLWLIEEINKAAPDGTLTYEVLGFISRDSEVLVQGVPVLGNDKWAFANLERNVRFVLAIGDSALRAQLALAYQKNGFHPLRLIHPSVVMSDEVEMGGGTIVCAGSVLTVNIQIGMFCIVNLNATIGHDCRIGDFVTLNPGVHLSGGSDIGDMSTLGTGAIVLPGMKVGDRSILGAGAVVTENLPGGATYIGVPAKETPAHHVPS